MNVAISCTGMSSGSFVLTVYNTQRLSSVLNENVLCGKSLELGHNVQCFNVVHVSK